MSDFDDAVDEAINELRAQFRQAGAIIADVGSMDPDALAELVIDDLTSCLDGVVLSDAEQAIARSAVHMTYCRIVGAVLMADSVG